jgi:alkylation response protein AidB-like acyl-CoA dehydrogenase
VFALLTDEQQMLRAAAASVASDVAIRNPRDLESRDPELAWTRLAQAGLLDLRSGPDAMAPEASGVEVMIVAEELGAVLAPVPYLGPAVMATELLRLTGSLGAWSGGGTAKRVSVLLRADLSAIATYDAVDEALVFDSRGVDRVLCVSRADGHGELLCLDHAELEPLDSADPTRGIARIVEAGEPDAVAVPPGALDRWLAQSLVAVSADLIGTMRGALAGVVEYARTRVQFGVPIGSFQAVQHLCAEAHVAIQATRSLTQYAAWAVDELDAGPALLAARAAKANASRVARPVCETVMQVYGGIGQTWENISHFYLRRALLDRQLLGDEDAQFDAIADVRLA